VFPLGAWLVAILNVLFITVLTWALVNGIIVACNCFGAPDTPPSAALMVQAILRSSSPSYPLESAGLAGRRAVSP